MVVMNTNDTDSQIGNSRFAERIGRFTKAVNVITERSLNLSDNLKFPVKPLRFSN